MSFLFLIELFAAYTFGGALLLLTGFATWDWLRDADARRRMARLTTGLGEADRAPDLFALALEEIRNLPMREHP